MTDFLTLKRLLQQEEYDVGKVKRSHVKLPPQSFTYGKSPSRDRDGTREAVQNWQYHMKSRDRSRGKDFKTINKMSIHSGLSNAREFREFGRTKDNFCIRNRVNTTLKLTLPEESFSYGAPNKPSTPMTNVMSKSLTNLANFYGMRAASQVQTLYKQRIEDVLPRSPLLPKLNKATKLCSEKTHERIERLNNSYQKPLFKMRKFLKVEHKIDDLNQTYISSKSLASPISKYRSISYDARA